MIQKLLQTQFSVSADTGVHNLEVF